MVLGALPLALFTDQVQSIPSTESPGHTTEALLAPLAITTTSYAWWDPNWHYRIPFNVIGTGNVSATVDFTENLTALQMTDKTLENSTITVVRYHQNGSVDSIVSVYNFKLIIPSQNNFHGVLTWQVSVPSRYYAYFDVVTNIGTRTPFPTSNLSASGNATISSFGPPEGWSCAWSSAPATYYLPDQPVTFNVSTTAKATNVTAAFSLNGTLSFSQTFVTINHLRWVNQTSFSQEGDWTVNITATDGAGYHAPLLTAEFFVGYPDLAVTKLVVNTAPYYWGKILTVQASVTCSYADLQQVNVSLYVSNTLVAYQNMLTFQKDHNTTVNLTWQPAKKGTVYLAVIVDYNNDIPESNEYNNERTMDLVIAGVPELGVVNITVPSQPVEEGNPATFHTCLRNKGDANATGYRVNLYLEQTTTNHTSLTSKEKAFIYVNISMNQTLNITLVWEAVEYGGSVYKGKWVAGIIILYNDTKPDSDISNNLLARYNRTLKVIPGDHTPPDLRVQNAPQRHEQGTPATFLVTATDASGIDTVTIAVKTPQNKYFNDTMKPLSSDRYQYILQNTSILGKYTYAITATDLSFNKTKKTISGSFTVVPDATPPIFEYYDAYPRVQLVNETIEFQCIASDFSGILGVDVTITLPDARTAVYHLRNESNGQTYSYSGRFSHTGKYEFTVTATDTLLNANTTDPETFWVTRDLNDTDSDGMPDAWETQHGLDPYDPTDASKDADDDGVTNLAEYKAGTNPNEKVTPTPNILLDNWPYVLGVLIVCVLIGGFAFYRLQRKKR